MLKNIFKIKRKRRLRRKVNKEKRERIRFLPAVNLGRSFRFFLVVLGLIVFLGVSFATFVLIRAYLSLDLDNETTWNGDDKLNILVVGIDDKGNGYKFVDSATIVVVDSKASTLGIFGIDPDLASKSGDRITIRKSYNLNNDYAPIENVVMVVEEITAVDIDKYVALAKEDFIQFSNLMGPQEIEINRGFNEPDFAYQDVEGISFEKGKNDYQGVGLMALAASDGMGNDYKLNMQNTIVSNYALKLGSIGRILNLANNASKLSYEETNLSKREVISLFLFFRKLNSSSIRTGYTRETSLVEYVDASEGVKRDYLADRLDKDLESIFLDSDILKEQSRLEVLNGTGEAGLATKYGRFLANNGIRIVRTGNSIKPSEKTILYIKEDKYPNTVVEIDALFDGQIEIIHEEYKYKHVGDMVLVLGEDCVKE